MERSTYNEQQQSAGHRGEGQGARAARQRFPYRRAEGRARSAQHPRERRHRRRRCGGRLRQVGAACEHSCHGRLRLQRRGRQGRRQHRQRYERRGHPARPHRRAERGLFREGRRAF